MSVIDGNVEKKYLHGSEPSRIYFNHVPGTSHYSWSIEIAHYYNRNTFVLGIPLF